MSKFKSFASQGSFRDYLLQAPDETAKIKEETAFKIKSKKEEMNWRQENNRIYLQAQRLVNSLEENNRETNFRLETENRQAFKDQLNEEYKLQVQADQQRANVEQRNLQNLSEFSKTAMKLGTQINDKITENQTKANASRAYAAGADYRTVVAIQGLTNNLTKAEFAQQDFIRDKLAEGGNVDAYFALYQARNTRGFINNVAVAQNSAYAFQDAARLHLAEYIKTKPSASIEEQRLAFRVFRDEYVSSFTDGNGRPLNPELLNSTVFPIIRRFETQILGEFDRQDDKAKEKERFGDVGRALNFELENNGATGVLNNWFTVEPSAKKRDDFLKWAENRLNDYGPNGLTTDQFYELINGKYDGPNRDKNGNPIRVSMMEQFAGTDFGGKLAELYNQRRRGEVSQTNLIETEAKQKLDANLTVYYNQVAQDGSISREDRLGAEKIAQDAGIPGYQSPVLDYFIKQEDSARYDAAARVVLDNLRAKGSLTLDYVQSLKGISGKTLEEYSAHAIRQEKYRTEGAHKTDIGAIEARVSQHPRIKAAPITGEKNYTVRLMQDRFRQRYVQYYEALGDRDKARARTIADIEALQSNQNAFTADGQYAEIVQQEKDFAKQGTRDLKNYKAALDVILNPETRNNYGAIADALGAEILYGAHDAIASGKPVPEMIKNISGLLRMSPFDFMNKTMENSGQPPLTLNTQVAQIQANMKPITTRLYNAPYSTDEMRGRANMINAGLPLPVRGQANARPLNTFAPQVSSIVMEDDSGQPGMDIFFEDKQFPAVLPGVVKEIGWQGNEQAGYGNYVVIESTDPSTGQKVDVLYSHLAMPTHLKEGSSVVPGMLVGKQGGTGSVRSADGTIASIDFLAPAAKGSGSMVPYRYFKQLREQIRAQLTR